jgi:CheY-like chemotaxis protein
MALMSESPPRVLVVDDEPFVVKIAQRVLERDGFDVLTAGTGEEALAMMEADPEVALVLLDSSLPDMNAHRVLELMRERELSTPVLLSSGFGADSLPSSEEFANVCGFLPKPYPVAQLSIRVRELLAGVRA